MWFNCLDTFHEVKRRRDRKKEVWLLLPFVCFLIICLDALLMNNVLRRICCSLLKLLNTRAHLNRKDILKMLVVEWRFRFMLLPNVLLQEWTIIENLYLVIFIFHFLVGHQPPLYLNWWNMYGNVNVSKFFSLNLTNLLNILVFYCWV